MVIETHSLNEGEACWFKVESVVDAQELQGMLGVNFAKMESKPAGEQGG